MLVVIDGYYEASENLNVQITTPNGTVLGPVPLGGDERRVPRDGHGERPRFPRERREPDRDRRQAGLHRVIQAESGQNMNGTWTFRFIPVALGAANGEVDLWRFFNSAGTTANFVVGNQPLEELVTEPGNAPDVITTARLFEQAVLDGLQRDRPAASPARSPVGTLASFSSPGPTRDGRQKPDIAAPGTAIGSSTSFDSRRSARAGASTELADGMQHMINAGHVAWRRRTSRAPSRSSCRSTARSRRPRSSRRSSEPRAIVDGNTGAVWNKDWGNGKLFLGDMVDPTVAVRRAERRRDRAVGHRST